MVELLLAELRSQGYVTVAEAKIERPNQLGGTVLRDALPIYRHALRVGEAIDLKWDQVDFDAAKLYVCRLKNGDDSVQFWRQRNSSTSSDAATKNRLRLLF